MTSQACNSSSYLYFALCCVLQSVIHAVVAKLARGDRAFQSSFAIRLQHIQTEESHWLHRDLTIGQIKHKYEKIHPALEWR